MRMSQLPANVAGMDTSSKSAHEFRPKIATRHVLIYKLLLRLTACRLARELRAHHGAERMDKLDDRKVEGSTRSRMVRNYQARRWLATHLQSEAYCVRTRLWRRKSEHANISWHGESFDNVHPSFSRLSSL